MFCFRNLFLYFIFFSCLMSAQTEEAVVAPQKSLTQKKEDSLYKKYFTIKNGLIGLGVIGLGILYYQLYCEGFAEGVADATAAHKKISDSTTGTSTDVIKAVGGDQKIISKKVGRDTIFSLKQKMKMDELVASENEELFFDLCMQATKMAEKQFVLHFNNSAQGVEMKFSPAQKEADKNTHSALCPFCGKINKTERTTDVVARKSGAIAFLTGSRSHTKCLIIPVTPIVRMSELQESHRTDVKAMAEIIREIIATYPEYKEFELEMHNGGAAAQSVHHLHWHFTVPGFSRSAQTAFTKMSGYEKAA